MRNLVLRLMMFIFLAVFFTGMVSAQCNITLTTDKGAYGYGEKVTATLYSDTCHFIVMYYYVYDSEGDMIAKLEPHVISSWPQQINYYWEQTDLAGYQVPPGTYEIADPHRARIATFTILGTGKLYALSLKPTGTPSPGSWKIAELVKIPLTTGIGIKIGATGASLDQQQWSLDLSFDSQGTLWAVNGVSRWNNLVIIDTETGLGTIVGSTGTLIEGIAFDADGTLYAADSGYNNWDSNGDRLVKIDINTFSYTEVGLTGWDIDGLGMSPDGILYGVDSGTLLQVDKNTGMVTPIGYLGGSGFYAITFSPDGIMYGANTNGDIYTIDPGTAVVSYVCSTGFPYVAGLSFAPLMPDDIDDYIQDLPDQCFKNNADQRKNAIHNKLIEVQALIDAGDYLEAYNKLIHDIIPKLDGEGNNDWIICPNSQIELLKMIDELIEYLEGLI